jgi:predicted amino acid-binding ACT domain protein
MALKELRRLQKEPLPVEDEATATRRRMLLVELGMCNVSRKQLHDEFPACEDRAEVDLDMDDEDVQSFIMQD